MKIDTSVTKQQRKKMRQATNGNRVSKDDEFNWMVDLLNRVNRSITLIEISPLISELTIRAEFMSNKLGFYDHENDVIRLNPCLVSTNLQLTTWLYPVLIHEICHWTGHEDRHNRAMGWYYDKNDVYPTSLSNKPLEQACEEYVCEFASRILCEQLCIERPMGNSLLVWLEEYMKYDHNRLGYHSMFDGTLLRLQNIGVSIANYVLVQADVTDYVLGRTDPYTEPLRVVN